MSHSSLNNDVAPDNNTYANNGSDSTVTGQGADEGGLLVDSSDRPGENATRHTRQSGGLPPGAMSPRNSVPPLPYRSVNTDSSGNNNLNSDSPTAKLLSTPSPTRVQFASYPDDEKERPWNTILPTSRKSSGEDKLRGWTPLPLRTSFWVSLVVFMVLVAIGLEVALYFSNKNLGWPTLGLFTTESGAMHFVYTLPPVAVATVFVTAWAWTDLEIKKMQPYVDLMHGSASAKSSLLLDYTRTSNFVAWMTASANKHYLVAITSLMALVALTFQPLAAALFTVRDTWWTEPDTTVSNLAAIGLNQDAQFQDLTSFLTAAGYASAAVLYNIGDPSFVHGAYTVAPFELPTNVATNGTVFANTTAVMSDPGCQPAESLSMEQLSDGSGWINNATFEGCTYSWQVSKTTTNLFGTSALTECGGSTTPQFSPVVFWFFTYQPSAAASITFCTPTISLWNVNVNVDLATGNVTDVSRLQPFQTGQSNFSSFSGNVTGPPLNGRAYNGIEFNLTNPDQYVLGRANATQLQMPAAVFEAAETSPEGLTAVFNTGKFVQLSTQVYTTYLKLIAKTVYFLPVQEPMTVQVKTVKKRLWLSDVAVHLLVAGILVLSVFGTIIHLFHRSERRNLRLTHQSGTIASAVSLGAQTNIGALLAGRQRAEDIAQALQGKKFRIDPQTMKIVMEGEEGYEEAASPDPRKSIFGALGLQGSRVSRRFSRPPSTPRETA